MRNVVRSVYRAIRPPVRWRIPVFVAAGALVGLGLYLVHVSRAFSYLSDDSRTCINCHVMGPQYAGWEHSSHREWATCNDCHVPHDNLIRSYAFKAQDGLRHATIFTLRQEPQAIIIKEAGRRAVQQNCIRCHEAILWHPQVGMGPGFRERWCWTCHREVPHGRTRSLSSVPNARVPTPGSMIPEWLRRYTKTNESRSR